MNLNITALFEDFNSREWDILYSVNFVMYSKRNESLTISLDSIDVNLADLKVLLGIFLESLGLSCKEFLVEF